MADESNNGSLPFLLTNGEDPFCHWYVGGRPPENALRIECDLAGTTYFATFPIDTHDPAGRVCSMFLGSFDDMLKESSCWHDLGVVKIVIHEPGPRVREWTALAEPESEHGIEILDRQDDLYEGLDDWIVGVGGQKFGGRPTFVQREQVEDDWDVLEKSGFRQLVQFEGPQCAPGVKVRGAWPFGGGVFSLARLMTTDRLEWRWCFQIG